MDSKTTCCSQYMVSFNASLSSIIYYLIPSSDTAVHLNAAHTALHETINRSELLKLLMH